MSDALERWNRLPAADAEKEIALCCGSRAWAREMAKRRPVADAGALLAASDEIWRGLGEQEWLEGFRSHPRIGESRADKPVEARSAAWSAQEQSGVGRADAGGADADIDAIKAALAEGNREYERRFGRIFIVCATGKSGAEMLEILRRRLGNDAETEMREAAEEQRKITRKRLERWMAG